MDGHFTHKEIQLISHHMEKCSALLAINEIKPPFKKQLYALIKLAKINKNGTTQYWQNYW